MYALSLKSFPFPQITFMDLYGRAVSVVLGTCEHKSAHLCY